MNQNEYLSQVFNKSQGILRLAPTWVPRSFCRPGKRIKLHPDDYYALGLERGGIDERWLASTTPADNGPGTPPDEGLSYIVGMPGEQWRMTLRDAIDALQDKIIGHRLWDKYGRWPMFSKFFDNAGPLPHHIHHNDQFAKKVGQAGKPEMYFFPAQMNNHGGEFPFTFFGLNPEVSKSEVEASLMGFAHGDNNILGLSRAYKLELDTGWDVPPGVLHAPGSLCTYEPQFASDVYAMYQSVLLNGQCVPESLLWKDCPTEEIGNFAYLLDIIDWELNKDPNFHANRFMSPLPVKPTDQANDDGYHEDWICYKCKEVSAKRLKVLPGKTVLVKDSAAYGVICLQGNGRFGVWDMATPTLIRYGELSNDEFFVSESAAATGVEITNHSTTEEMIMLKHFAENPDLPDLDTKGRCEEI